MGKLREIIQNLKNLFSKKSKDNLDAEDIISSEDRIQTFEVDEEVTEVRSSSENTGSFFKKLASKALDKTKKSNVTPKKSRGKRSRTSRGSSGVTLEELLGSFFSERSRPFIHKVFKGSMAIAFSFSIAKLLALTLSQGAVKKPTPPEAFALGTVNIAKDTNAVIKRNIFNSERLGAVKKVAKKKVVPKGPCRKASTQGRGKYRLLNTIVLQNEGKSIATISGGGKSFSNIRQGEKVKDLGEVGLIVRKRVIYRSSKSGQCEYIGMKEETKIKNKVKVLSQSRGKKILKKLEEDQGIKAEGNTFEIKRAYLNEKLEDIGSILRQAKATPVKNPDGTLSFKITDVVPGSVYNVIGVQNGDFISKIDGKPISNVNEVLSLFRKIKTVSKLNITVKRNGADQTLNYNIK